MKLTTDFVSMRLDKAAYLQDLLDTLREANERAGRAWVEAAVLWRPIPVWSGASRATFQKLANELGTSIPIGPRRSKKDRVPLGLATSKGSGVFDKGYYVGFVYETNLRYLAYNEYNKATAGPPPQPFSDYVRYTPYHFQRHALAAWQEEAEKVKLPNLWDYITKRKL